MSGWVLSCVVPHPYGDGGAPPSPCRGGRLFTAGPQRGGVVLKPTMSRSFRFGALAYSNTRLTRVSRVPYIYIGIRRARAKKSDGTQWRAMYRSRCIAQSLGYRGRSALLLRASCRRSLCIRQLLSHPLLWPRSRVRRASSALRMHVCAHGCV